MSSQSLSGTAISEPNKALMPKRFYAAWVFVVILAAVLPVAIPYFIWPPQNYERGSFDGAFPPNLFGALVAGLSPKHVSVEPGPRPGIEESGCSSGVAWNHLRQVEIPKLVLRGAYGIPFGSVEYTCTSKGDKRLFLGGGL